MKMPTILVLLFMLTGTAIAEPKEKETKSYFIEKRQFVGFEECRTSKALQETMKRLMKTEAPKKKEPSAWTYSTKTEVLGLPVTSIMIGTCGISGSRDCGWGNFIALVIPRPIEAVKKELKKQFGADFTEEKRENEYNVTLRPVLAKGKKSSESILFCDPGSL